MAPNDIGTPFLPLKCATSLFPDAKRTPQQRHRNNVASQECRARKRERIAATARNLEIVKAENVRLLTELKAANATNAQLEQQLQETRAAYNNLWLDNQSLRNRSSRSNQR
jgi:predicted RNase H-like nuclease (RuvC/YqgF family)